MNGNIRTVAATIAVTFAAILAGCVSIESTKAKLASGNSQLVREANDAIYVEATDRNKPLAHRLGFVDLTDDMATLERIFERIRFSNNDDCEVGRHAVKRMTFKSAGTTLRFLKEHRRTVSESSFLDNCGDGLLKKMFAETPSSELPDIVKYFADHGEPYEWRVPFAIQLAKTTESQSVLYELVLRNISRNAMEELDKAAIPRISDQDKLVQLFGKSGRGEKQDHIVARITDEDALCRAIRDTDNIYNLVCGGKAEIIVNKVSDKKKLVNAIAERKSGDDTIPLLKELTQIQLAAVACRAKAKDLRWNAIGCLKDAAAIKQILAGNHMTDEEGALKLASKLKVGDVDAATYNRVTNPKIRKVLFAAIGADERVQMRKADRARCEKKIKDNLFDGSKTFYLGGFYLGMPFSDIESLVGYYFPEWATSEYDEKDGGKSLYVPQQKAPFCYADKSGKVYQFNFGKAMLARICRGIDAQTHVDWWLKYMTIWGIEKLVMENHTGDYENLAGTRDPWGPKILAHFQQPTYTYKDRKKKFMIEFFDECTLIADGDNHLSQSDIIALAKRQFGNKIGQPGSLRVYNIYE